jgi:hypothetical protein
MYSALLVDEGDHFLNGPSNSALAKYADALRRFSFAQVLLPDLALPRLDRLLFIRRRAGPLALIALGLPDSAPQRLRRAADLGRDLADRRPLRGVPPLRDRIPCAPRVRGFQSQIWVLLISL